MTQNDESGARIFRGTEESFGKIGHLVETEGITRHLLMTNQMIKGKSFHIAIHDVSEQFDPVGSKGYTIPHSHDVDEINLLVANKGKLTCLVELDGVEETVESPACIYIPAGVQHRTEVCGGVGTFICIKFDQQTA